MPKNRLFEIAVLFIVAGVVFSACGGAATPLAPAGQPTAQPVSPLAVPDPLRSPVLLPESADATKAAKELLAEQLKLDTDKITILGVKAVIWSNGCLDAGLAGENCTQALVPGYQGVLQTPSALYEFRSDKSGQNLRIIPDAVQVAKQALAKEFKLASDSINVVNYEAVMWRDGCLEVRMGNQPCTDVVVPGYRIILESAGKKYEYRTDESGNTIKLANSLSTPD